MRRKETSLLVESWRSFINESVKLSYDEFLKSSEKNLEIYAPKDFTKPTPNDKEIMYKDENDFVTKMKSEIGHLINLAKDKSEYEKYDEFDYNEFFTEELSKALPKLFVNTVYEYTTLENFVKDFENESKEIEEALRALYVKPGNWVEYERDRPKAL